MMGVSPSPGGAYAEGRAPVPRDAVSPRVQRRLAHQAGSSMKTDISRRNGLPHRVRGGFTLVELLVVIGIIAVLMSLLLPAYGKMKAQAKTTECQKSLRQLYAACLAF